ncbi:magnesium transporter [Kocuria sp. SM24M-10]|uniref:magnesium transporter n=1 Tax=Kocuria sp. SM24M-10 TaxID=1660349 RepID=UPI00069C21B5|nr:magnesium transporter [Kocuria sp. SM24M-10]
MDTSLPDRIRAGLRQHDLEEVRDRVLQWDLAEQVELLERLSAPDRAVVYRLLPREAAFQAFGRLDTPLQGELLTALRSEEVSGLVAELDPDDRVKLLDELPVTVARTLLVDLSPEEQDATGLVMGYPPGSVGRRMSPEFVALDREMTVEQARAAVLERIHDAETVYALPVLDGQQRLCGIVGLRRLLATDGSAPLGQILREAVTVEAHTPAEEAARRCAEEKLLALPVVDGTDRLVGILTFDDALDVLEEAESEDVARSGGAEPLRRPYLSTPVRAIVRSRVVWLLVLAVGATLTVRVLEVFEATLEQMVVLSVFIPLLIGTGGNTGNQAATTVTRAVALGDVRVRDVGRVALREVRVGALLGTALGTAGLLGVGLLYGWAVGAVIGLTLLSVCVLAATVGGIMPLVARALKVDPAVFSNPFITTFVDASGLVVYFLIATAVLGL